MLKNGTGEVRKGDPMGGQKGTNKNDRPCGSFNEGLGGNWIGLNGGGSGRIRNFFLVGCQRNNPRSRCNEVGRIRRTQVPTPKKIEKKTWHRSKENFRVCINQSKTPPLSSTYKKVTTKQGVAKPHLGKLSLEIQKKNMSNR